LIIQPGDFLRGAQNVLPKLRVFNRHVLINKTQLVYAGGFQKVLGYLEENAVNGKLPFGTAPGFGDNGIKQWLQLVATGASV
jgi:hypothetical protein